MTGPQLVLPQDRCGARHISAVTAIRVDGSYRCTPTEVAAVP